jgi:hypothetical protein
VKVWAAGTLRYLRLDLGQIARLLLALAFRAMWICFGNFVDERGSGREVYSLASVPNDPNFSTCLFALPCNFLVDQRFVERDSV